MISFQNIYIYIISYLVLCSQLGSYFSGDEKSNQNISTHIISAVFSLCLPPKKSHRRFAMSRRVLLPCALLALAVLVPCFVGGGPRGGHGRALRVPREGTAAPKATTETPKPKEEPKEPKEPKAETPKSVALVQVTKEKLGEVDGK